MPNITIGTCPLCL